MLYLLLNASMTCMHQILGAREMCINIKATFISEFMPQHHFISTYKEECSVYLHTLAYVVIYNIQRCH